MRGQIVSHYRVIDEIGRGGMGRVYEAEDERLHRTVALKFLPAESTDDADAKRRFVQEAQAASALDHPNICTIHEIDQSPDGHLFLVMPRYRGETLRERVGRGPLEVAEALDLALQVANGLRKAHEAGIVHRDIKSANLFLTSDGVVKILDFGLVKLSRAALALTQTGVVLGTVSYMAPEQIRGQAVDARADIWSLAVVLFELLTGRLPFVGDGPSAVMQAVLNQPAPSLEGIRANVPQRLADVVASCLQKNPDDRVETVADLQRELLEIRESLSVSRTAAAESTPAGRRWTRWIGATAAIVAVVAIGWVWREASMSRWARNEAIPEIEQLIERGEVTTAFALVQRATQYLANDPVLDDLRTAVTASYTVASTPSGADVYVREYTDTDGEWQELGLTPITVNLPRRALRWRIEREGFRGADLAMPPQPLGAATENLNVELQATDEHPADMTYVPAGVVPNRVGGFSLPSRELDAFFIDRYEVSNHDFKEFVDAGGYERAQLWTDMSPVVGGRPVPFKEAVARFVDATGRAGPAHWELGDYANEEADRPVTGVSWYEAAAYARFRGGTLPTIYHWLRAALVYDEVVNGIGPWAAPLSNFESDAPTPRGAHHGMGPYGTFDMFGNVREWIANAGAAGGWLLGGSFQDPSYSFSSAAAARLDERSALNGFRVVRTTSVPDELRASVELGPPTRQFKPVSDEVYAALQRQFAYTSGPLKASEVVHEEETDDWIRERVTIDAGYNGERLDLLIFLPKGFSPPYQSLVYFPGIDVVLQRLSSDDFGPLKSYHVLDHLIKAGRALVLPIYQGTYERWQAPWAPFDEIRTPREWIERRWDLGRAIDYLESRDEFDTSKLGYVGTSFGASWALPLVAVEPRIRTALLLSGNLVSFAPPPITDPVNYVPRIKIPVLMINGRFDFIAPLNGQRPLYELLGTPADDKRWVRLDAGHLSFPRQELVRETVNWLDRYLGPVD